MVLIGEYLVFPMPAASSLFAHVAWVVDQTPGLNTKLNSNRRSDTASFAALCLGAELEKSNNVWWWWPLMVAVFGIEYYSSFLS